MKKKVIPTGGESIGIRFTKPERETYDIEEGDIIDLTDMTIEKHKEAEENLSNILAKQKQNDDIKEIRRRMKQ